MGSNLFASFPREFKIIREPVRGFRTDFQRLLECGGTVELLGDMLEDVAEVHPLRSMSTIQAYIKSSSLYLHNGGYRQRCRAL